MSDRILDVIGLVEQVGWQLRLQRRRAVTYPQWPISEIPTPNGAAIGLWAGSDAPPCLAPGGPGTRRGGCSVRMVWTSRTDPGHTTLDAAFPPGRGLREPTWFYLPLELSGPLPPTDISEFAAPALDQHEHAVAVLVELGYYSCALSERPLGVPRLLMPRPW